jgi:hypothetical protein
MNQNLSTQKSLASAVPWPKTSSMVALTLLAIKVELPDKSVPGIGTSMA